MKLSLAVSRRARQLHRALAPIIALPLLLTLITGVGFQFAIVAGVGEQFEWLLAVHRGDFGKINLEMIYVFLNGGSLLFLLVTGILLWLQSGRRSRPHPPTSGSEF